MYALLVALFSHSVAISSDIFKTLKDVIVNGFISALLIQCMGYHTL